MYSLSPEFLTLPESKSIRRLRIPTKSCDKIFGEFRINKFIKVTLLTAPGRLIGGIYPRNHWENAGCGFGRSKIIKLEKSCNLWS